MKKILFTTDFSANADKAFYFALNMIGIAGGIGLQILVARKSGEGKISEINKRVGPNKIV